MSLLWGWHGSRYLNQEVALIFPGLIPGTLIWYLGIPSSNLIYRANISAPRVHLKNRAYTGTSLTVGFSVGALCSVGLDKYTMICIQPHCVVRNGFILLGILCAFHINFPSPNPWKLMISFIFSITLPTACQYP